MTCSSASAFYPNGHATAVVVDPNATLPRAWAARFREAYGIAPMVKAYRAYLGTQAILTALSQHGVTTQDSPPKLDRDALAAELVRGHSGCA
jgi:ABC-type branched-subunit amino acid transport system substrate-binding protein